MEVKRQWIPDLAFPGKKEYKKENALSETNTLGK